MGAKQVDKASDMAEGSAKVVRYGVAECFEFPIGRFKLGGSVANALFELDIKPAHLLLHDRALLLQSSAFGDVVRGTEEPHDATMSIIPNGGYVRAEPPDSAGAIEDSKLEGIGLTGDCTRQECRVVGAIVWINSLAETTQRSEFGSGMTGYPPFGIGAPLERECAIGFHSVSIGVGGDDFGEEAMAEFAFPESGAGLFEIFDHTEQGNARSFRFREGKLLYLIGVIASGDITKTDDGASDGPLVISDGVAGVFYGETRVVFAVEVFVFNAASFPVLKGSVNRTIFNRIGTAVSMMVVKEGVCMLAGHFPCGALKHAECRRVFEED